MKKPYDKKNNDTYVEIYANGLASDVEAHMFKNDSGRVVSFGGIKGDFSVESKIIAENNVLHFESPKSLGVKGLKTMNMRTLVPYSLMKRYSANFLNCDYTQKTPILFDIEKEKFILPMDNRVMRDMKEYPEFRNGLNDLINNGDVSIIEVENESQLLLNYNSINDLKNDAGDLYKKIKDLYSSTLMDLYPTEDVIIVFTAFKNNKENYLGASPQNFSRKEDLNHEFNNCSIGFEYIKAKKISDKNYFLYDENDNLLKNKKFYCDKDKIWEEIIESEKRELVGVMLGNDSKILILPYTKLDWDLLSGLKKKMDSIFSELAQILLTQKTTEGFDGSLQNIEVNEHILLKSVNKQLRLK